MSSIKLKHVACVSDQQKPTNGCRHCRPEWLSREDIAARYGISKDTLAHWASDRKGPPFMKIGKRAMYENSDVLAWFRMQKIYPEGKGRYKQ